MTTASPSTNSTNLFSILLLSLIFTLQPNLSLAEEEQETSAEQTKKDASETKQTEQKKAPTPKVDRPRVTAPTHNLVNKWLMDRTPKAQLRWLSDTGLEMASPEADENGKIPFLALHAKERYGKPKGAVILLHADGQRAGWPDSLLALHEQLPDSGWHSLFISLPPPPIEPVPKRSDPHPLLAHLQQKSEKKAAEGTKGDQEAKKDEESEKSTAKVESEKTPEEADNENKGLSDEEIDKLEQDENGGANTEESTDKGTEESTKESGEDKKNDTNSTENKPKTAENSEKEQKIEKSKPKAPEIPVEKQIQKRIQAAVNYLNKSGQFNLVLVGQGSAAIHAATYISNMPRPTEPGRFAPIQAAVLMNAKNTQFGTTKNLPDQVDKLNMPVLDIIDQQNEGIKNQAATRLKNIPRLKRKTYQYVMMPATRTFDVNRKATGQNSDRMAKRIRGWIEKKVTGQEMGAVIEP